MQTLTAGGHTFEIVDGSARQSILEIRQDLTNRPTKQEVKEAIEEVDVREQLKNYPTKREMQEAVNAVDVSEQLKNYPTKQEMQEAIEEIDVSEQLKNYPTKQEVQEAIEKVDVSEQLTDYPTKQEVQETIATKLDNDYYNKSQSEEKFAPISADNTAKTNAENIANISNVVAGMQEQMKGFNTDPPLNYDVSYESETGLFRLYEYEKDAEPSDDNVKKQFIITGGSSGPTSSTTTTIERITLSPLIIVKGKSAIIEYNYSSLDSSGEDTGEGTAVWKVGSDVIATTMALQGYNSFDVTKYLQVGSHKVLLTVTDAAGGITTKYWTVQIVDVYLQSTFNDTYTYPLEDLTFSYRPYGAVSKTIYFKLDGEELGTVETSVSGIPLSYTIPAQPHGSHLLEVYATANINGTTIETESIFEDILFYDKTTGIPVIGCATQTIDAMQYDTIGIEYTVVDPSTEMPTVTLSDNGEVVSVLTLQRPTNKWTYKTDIVGPHTLSIACGETVKTININIKELDIDVQPITANLAFDFNPVGKSNNSANRLWTDGTTSMTVSDNFDWANGGYQVDENGDQYFCIKAGTRAIIDYKMFSGGINSNPSVKGSEMKVIFKTENVQDANAVWFTNVENGVGIQMSVHEGWLKTNTASNTDVEGDGDSESIAATNTYLHMPYGEEDIIEMDINISPLDRDDSTAKAFVMAYEDGVPSKAFVYDSSDRFYQYTPQPMTIGSDHCDVRIYRLKAYSSSLTTEDVMKNFIADSRNSTTMLDRYHKNSIYYNRDTNTYTPYSSGGILDPEKLAPIIPNVKVLMLETDHFTTSKKTFVKSKLRCIHATGGSLFVGDPHLDNWLFENGYHSGQGTTSDNYGNSGRNVDFLFNADGVHKPSDKVDAEEGYVSQITLGYGTETPITEIVTDWKGDDGKVALTRTSVPNNFFNMKVNVASSENVNNALLQKRYNDFLPYISPAKKRDSKIKNSMEFVPAILFIKETNPDISTHNEFLDNEWHFYALGNLGDSKKTDYTRAYDPEDMNEFVIEISDNTKNNATFQSGVYLDENGNRQIERFTITETEDDGDIILTPVSTDKPQSFVYPITLEEWENENNMRYWCMYNEGFDGDHSFEPRYACCGDYRDGKLVNDTTGRGKAQVALNNDVWRAFYRWVITSTDDEFKNELDQWCVRSAVEFFYAFTHMYTMMDNRAKNTFWHFAKTGVYREVSRPVSELLHIYCELINGEYVTTTDTEINNRKTYYTQYAFDLWDYDNDTALGINNNGELIFPYGKEDIDYNIDGNPASGYVFNGATSVFWCRLRDLLPGEITSTFQNVTAECFSSTHLINQFDEYQECFPEELWRLDIQRKYIRTFTGESVDNSKPKHDVQYLRDMMQGRKKYQRRQWVRDQEMYFGTKNLMNTVVGDNNRITFRCFTPTGDDIVVEPDYTLRIVPYSDMYVSVMFGNGGTQQVRAKSGVEYTIECPLATMDDTQVTIYGANRIQELSDLSACYIAANNFSMADKLRKLVLGNTTPGYDNSRLVSLTLGKNKLLEELDIRNCRNLTGSINLAECNNLLKLYAEGTSLTGVTFATNGKVQIAHLPNTINTLTMRNLNNLTDFQATLDMLETLTLQGGTLDNYEIISNCIDTLRVLYLYDIDWTGTNSLADVTLLNQIYNLFHSLITGQVYVSVMKQLNLEQYKEAWPDLDITYGTMVSQYKVTFLNHDGSPILDKNGNPYIQYVDRGSTPYDPIEAGDISTPVRESDAQYIYTFSGWDSISDTVLANKNITAQYSTETQVYTVRWLSQAGTVLQSTTAEYGDCVEYTGETPVLTDEESSYVYKIFAGWNKSTGCIRSDLDVYAIWNRAELPAVGVKELKDMSVAELYAIKKAGNFSDYAEIKDYVDIRVGHDFDFENVESELICENEYFDGKKVIDTGIKLFDADAPSFTLVIDYEFGSTKTNNTLVSCYEESGSEGFRFRYGSQPDIQWGDINVNVGYNNFRNIIVIRHVQNSNKLSVTSFNSVSDDIYTDDIRHYSLTRTRDTKTEATLVLGAVKYVNDDAYDSYGTGWIHWCKIWYDDLGKENANHLASWPRETWRFEYYPSPYKVVGSNVTFANASFVSNALLRQPYVVNTTTTNSGGWRDSAIRSFVNEKVFNAFSVSWRNLIQKVQVKSSVGDMSTEIVTTEDEIYIPSYLEVDPTVNKEPYLSEIATSIPWFTGTDTRSRFSGIIIPEDHTRYNESSDPTALLERDFKTGDIWNNRSDYDIDYMYVSKDDPLFTQHITTTNAVPAADGGEWIKANSYTTRSASILNATGFVLVNIGGDMFPDHPNAANRARILPCFSI